MADEAQHSIKTTDLADEVRVLRADVDLLLKAVNAFHDYPEGAVKPQTSA